MKSIFQFFYPLTMRNHLMIFLLVAFFHSAYSAEPLSCQTLLLVAPKVHSPMLLGRQESDLRKLMGPNAVETLVRRGLTLKDYKGEHLIQFLFGNWDYHIASHDFSILYRSLKSSGVTSDAAVQATASHILNKISGEIQTNGYTMYAITQSRATYLGYKVESKRATGMSSYPVGEAPISEIALTATPFSYASTGYNGIVSKENISPDTPMIVIDVLQAVPSDSQGEFVIPSHIPPTKIKKFYLGFSNWFNVKDYHIPPKTVEKWYEFEIKARDHMGRPSIIAIKQIVQHIQGYYESWHDQQGSWSSDRLTSKSNKDFETENSILKNTIQAINDGIVSAPK